MLISKYSGQDACCLHVLMDCIFQEHCLVQTDGSWTLKLGPLAIQLFIQTGCQGHPLIFQQSVMWKLRLGRPMQELHKHFVAVSNCETNKHTCTMISRQPLGLWISWRILKLMSPCKARPCAVGMKAMYPALSVDSKPWCCAVFCSASSGQTKNKKKDPTCMSFASNLPRITSECFRGSLFICYISVVPGTRRGGSFEKRNNCRKKMVYRKVFEMQKQRSVEPTNEHMVVEMPMKWHERIRTQLTEWINESMG